MKVGVRYLVVIDSFVKNELFDSSCESSWKFIGYIPSAFEIVNYGMRNGLGGAYPSMFVLMTVGFYILILRTQLMLV